MSFFFFFFTSWAAGPPECAKTPRTVPVANTPRVVVTCMCACRRLWGYITDALLDAHSALTAASRLAPRPPAANSALPLPRMVTSIAAGMLCAMRTAGRHKQGMASHVDHVLCETRCDVNGMEAHTRSLQHAPCDARASSPRLPPRHMLRALGMHACMRPEHRTTPPSVASDGAPRSLLFLCATPSGVHDDE